MGGRGLRLFDLRFLGSLRKLVVETDFKVEWKLTFISQLQSSSHYVGDSKAFLSLHNSSSSGGCYFPIRWRHGCLEWFSPGFCNYHPCSQKQVPSISSHTPSVPHPFSQGWVRRKTRVSLFSRGLKLNKPLIGLKEECIIFFSKKYGEPEPRWQRE